MKTPRQILFCVVGLRRGGWGGGGVVAILNQGLWVGQGGGARSTSSAGASRRESTEIGIFSGGQYY